MFLNRVVPSTQATVLDTIQSNLSFLGRLNSFPTWLLLCCTDEYAHTNDFSTYLVSSDRVSDSSSELQCLGSPYMLCVCILNIRTMYIHP